ncbi:hypothetical protein NQF86_09100, partial [Bombella sp. TMW 2.2543]|nr:hypothetical protein [Bombella pluederhausensis]
LALQGAGTIATSSLVSIDKDAKFDISGTNNGASVTDIGGAGGITLGDKTLTLTQANPDTVYQGVITGKGGLTISGGTETLTGQNTYEGITQVDQGAGLNLNGGSLAGSLQNDGTATINGGTVNGVTTNTNTLTATGGTLASAINSGTMTLQGKSTVQSDVTQKAGSLTLDDSTINGKLAADGGSFNVGQNGASVGSLSGNAGGSLAEGGTLTLTNAKAGDSYDGVLTGKGGLTIAGGTETLTGQNTYEGTTQVNKDAGLKLSGSLAGALTNDGTTTINGGTVNNTTTNTYDLDVTGGTLSDLINKSGKATIENGSTVKGTTTNSATLDVTDSKLQDLQNNAGQATLSDSMLASATNSGTLKLQGESKVQGDVTQNNGLLTLQDESNVQGNITQNDGTVKLLDGSTVQGSVTQKAGTLTLDDSTINGKLAANGGSFNIDQNGASVGSLSGNAGG